MFLNDAKTKPKKLDHADNVPKNSRPMDGTATLKACQPTLGSLLRGNISSFRQTDHRCLEEAISATSY